MKNVIVIFIIFLMPALGICQDTYDDIKLSVCGNSPKVFYEGQCFFLTTCLENLSNVEKQYDQYESLILEFENFRNTDTGEKIENQFSKAKFYYVDKNPALEKLKNPNPAPPIKRQEITTVNRPFSANGKYFSSIYLSYVGNRTITDILNLSDSLFYRPVMPQYLSPGNYEITLKVTLDPGGHELKTIFPFKVLVSEGKIREEMLNYLNAYKEDFLYNRVLNERPWPEKIELPQLYYFLLNNKESIYATEVIRILYLDYFPSQPRIVDLFQKDLKNIYQLYQILPQIKSYKSDEIALGFLKSYFKIKDFEDAGLIGGIKDYTMEYLKQMQDYGPQVSARLIYKMGEDYNIKGLENYSNKKSSLK